MAALSGGRNNRFLTIETAKDTTSVNNMTGSKVREILTISKQKQFITYEFHHVHHRMKIDITNRELPKVDIYVTLGRKLTEIHPSLHHYFSMQPLNPVLAKKMALPNTIQRIQKQYKFDVLGIDDLNFLVNLFSYMTNKKVVLE